MQRKLKIYIDSNSRKIDRITYAIQRLISLNVYDSKSDTIVYDDADKDLEAQIVKILDTILIEEKK